MNSRIYVFHAVLAKYGSTVINSCDSESGWTTSWATCSTTVPPPHLSCSLSAINHSGCQACSLRVQGSDLLLGDGDHLQCLLSLLNSSAFVSFAALIHIKSFRMISSISKGGGRRTGRLSRSYYHHPRWKTERCTSSLCRDYQSGLGLCILDWSCTYFFFFGFCKLFNYI